MLATFFRFVLAAILLSLPSFGARAETVSFAIGEWRPFTGEALPGNGLAVEIVTAACRAVDLHASFTFMPWPRAETDVAEGRFFGTFPYRETPERQDRFFLSSPLVLSDVGILRHIGNVKTSHFRYAAPDDLQGYTVGILFGSDAIKQPLEKSGVIVEEVNTVEQSLYKLRMNRIDFYIDSKIVLNEALQKSMSKEERASFEFLQGGFDAAQELRILVSKKQPNNARLLEKIDLGLEKIKASGEYKKILGYYGL